MSNDKDSKETPGEAMRRAAVVLEAHREALEVANDAMVLLKGGDVEEAAETLIEAEMRWEAASNMSRFREVMRVVRDAVEARRVERPVVAIAKGSLAGGPDALSLNGHTDNSTVGF